MQVSFDRRIFHAIWHWVISVAKLKGIECSHPTLSGSRWGQGWTDKLMTWEELTLSPLICSYLISLILHRPHSTKVPWKFNLKLQYVQSAGNLFIYNRRDALPLSPSAREYSSKMKMTQGSEKNNYKSKSSNSVPHKIVYFAQKMLSALSSGCALHCCF